MNNKDTTCRAPEDFNLFTASDTLLGVLESIHRMTLEEPPQDEAERNRWMNSLHGLAWAGLKEARATNAFLTEASDTHRFPATYADIGFDTNRVRELAPPLYVVGEGR